MAALLSNRAIEATLYLQSVFTVFTTTVLTVAELWRQTGSAVSPGFLPLLPISCNRVGSWSCRKRTVTSARMTAAFQWDPVTVRRGAVTPAKRLEWKG